MNGLESALKVAIGLCFVIFICVISLTLFVGPPSTDELAEVESKYGYHDVDLDYESEEEIPNRFQFLAHSYLSNGDITVQLRYSGKEIAFEKKKMEILIHGKPCSCAWKVIKMNGKSLNTLVDGDTLYLTISVPRDAQRGDAITVVYEPEQLVTSFIL